MRCVSSKARIKNYYAKQSLILRIVFVKYLFGFLIENNRTFRKAEGVKNVIFPLLDNIEIKDFEKSLIFVRNQGFFNKNLGKKARG